MGSSTSKPRKGHKNPKHLPKVGTSANDAWDHDQRQRQLFGSGLQRALIAVLLLVVLVGLIAITA